MSLTGLDGLGWLLLMLGPLLLFQRWLHRELQAIFLVITRRPNAAVMIFSLLFLPGVALHESSHFLAARLLGVRTVRFSLIPQAMRDGRLRLGYVETGVADPLRDALIGFAPLLSGGLVVAYIGIQRLNLLPLGADLAQGKIAAFLQGVSALPEQADFWLWFYLLFVVSSTMLPSSADRRGWLPVVIGAMCLLGLALLAGAGPWMAANVAPWVERGLRALAAVLGISLAAHVVLLAPAAGLRWGLERLTGLKVV